MPDQPVTSVIPEMHDLPCEFRFAGLQPASATSRYVLTFCPFNKGGTAVDLALRRLDVLAVCAVFVFLGAVLFGAF